MFPYPLGIKQTRREAQVVFVFSSSPKGTRERSERTPALRLENADVIHRHALGKGGLGIRTAGPIAPYSDVKNEEEGFVELRLV